jgi:small conductance mechanosensitive channel
MPLNMDKFYGYMMQYGLQIAAAVCILIIGHWVAKVASNVLERSLNRIRFHRTLSLFVKHLVFYALLTFFIIASLNKLGVETSSFIAVLGAISLAVGLALQGSLSNFAAGIMIIVLSLFEIGDTIEAGGVQGEVEEIQIFNTVIITTDKKRVIVPNSKVTGDKITIFPRNIPAS